MPTLGLLDVVHDYVSGGLGRNALSARRFRLFATTGCDKCGLRQISIVAGLALLFTLLVVAGKREKVKQQTPTLRGPTGLFNLPNSDTLRQGEFSFGLHGSSFNREPGDIDITAYPFSLTLGLHDRVEFSFSFEAYKRINADAIAVPLDPFGGRRLPRLTHLANGSPRPAYFNDTPFLNLGFGQGSGDLWMSFKLNLLSERYGDRLGLALQPVLKFSVGAGPHDLLEGLTPGLNDYGLNLILTKNISEDASLTLMSGLMWAEDSDAVERQNRANWGLGVDVPLGTRTTHLIGELVGSTFWGGRDGALANPKSPVDLYAGIRIFPARRLALSAAYNFYANRIDPQQFLIQSTDRSGWFFQLDFQHKINRPPTIECRADPRIVAQVNPSTGHTVTISADIDDPDDDVLMLTWKTQSGRIRRRNTSALFETTGLRWGSYTVQGEVSDGESLVSCRVQVDVVKDRRPPSVTCEALPAAVVEGQSTTLRATAVDPNGDALHYAWTVDEKTVTNDRSEFEFGTASRSVGVHSVRVRAVDVDGMKADCDFQVTISRRPNTSPRVALTLDKKELYRGERLTAAARAVDDDGDPLVYSWTLDGASHDGGRPSITVDTVDLTAGRHAVAVRVLDDRGAADWDAGSFAVREKVVLASPLDNVGKARLDAIALRMRQMPRLRVVLTGHTDSRGSQSVNEHLGRERAREVQDYLVEQLQIEPGRIELRSQGERRPRADNSTAAGRRLNRRVEMELYVPP